MSQQEINDLMNPDDIEAPPEEDGAHFESDGEPEKEKPAVQDA